MSDFEVIGIYEHNRLKQELEECKAALKRKNEAIDKAWQLVNKSDFFNQEEVLDILDPETAPPQTPEQIPLGKAKHWGDEE